MKISDFLKTKKMLVFLLTCALFLSACSSDSDKKKTKNTRPENIKSQYLDDYLKAKWLNHLPKYEFGDVEKSENGFSYQYHTESSSNVEIAKKVEYEKNVKGNYQGKMTVDFSDTAESYVLEIPKEFASHLNELDFSLLPNKIINPDPIVEFEGVKEEIIIKALETKTEDEINAALEKQIIDAEAKNCQSLTEKEAVGCMLSLISKYRDSEYIEEELKHENMAELSGASAQAVLQNNVKTCRHVTDRSQKELCYEYAYQTLVKDCDKKTGTEYRECVRYHSGNLPGMEEQRLFCGHITDEQMRKECQGLSPLESCNEIENQEKKELCKLNILRTKNDLRECSKLEDGFLKQACFAVIGADREDASVCKKVKDEYLKGQCLIKVAMISDDKDLCTIIKDEKSRDLCVGHFVSKLEVNKKMCEAANELFIKELCEMTLAVNEKDVEKCNDPKIIGPDAQATCLAGIGMKHGDASVCGMIDITIGEFEQDRKLREMIRDLCYMKVAIDKNNASLCNKIEDPKQKKACKDEVDKPEEEEEEKEETQTMKCSDVGPATICPMNNADKKGASINTQDNGRDVQCTYKGKKDGFLLHNEVYRLENKWDGTYKEYDEMGNIKKFSQHKDGQKEGFSIECDSAGKLQKCWFYRSGKSSIDCME